MDTPLSSRVSAAYSRACHLESFGLSDLGRLRNVNQDSFALRTKRGLFVVADGRGVHASGRIASRMAVDRVCEAVDPFPEERLPKGLPAERESSGALLAEAIQRANRHLLSAAFVNPVLTGMVSGIVGALFSPGHVAIAHVGDCCAYRLRERRLEQLTTDHSLLNESIREGLYRPEEGGPAPSSSFLTRGLGLEIDVAVDVRRDRVESGDVYLLCSDGLSDRVATAEINAILLFEHDLGRAAERLVQRAYNLGGCDTITLELVRVIDPGACLSLEGASTTTADPVRGVQ